MVIISHKSIKRELGVPFAMCGKVDDMVAIAQEIIKQARMLPGKYGWIKIDLSHPSDFQANTKPLAWTDASNVNPPSDILRRHEDN